MTTLDSILQLAAQWVSFSGQKEDLAAQWGTIERSIGDQVDVAAKHEGITQVTILQNPNNEKLHVLNIQLSEALQRNAIAARFGEGKKVKTNTQENPFQWRFKMTVNTDEGETQIRVLTDDNRDGSVLHITLAR